MGFEKVKNYCIFSNARWLPTVMLQWFLLLLSIRAAKWQTALRAFLRAKREICGLKIHLPPWYWLAAEMSNNFARPMRLSYLSARITSTFGLQPALQIYKFLSFSQPLFVYTDGHFHTIVSCYISVKRFFLMKWIGTIWPCVLIIMIIKWLFSGI